MKHEHSYVTAFAIALCFALLGMFGCKKTVIYNFAIIVQAADTTEAVKLKKENKELRKEIYWRKKSIQAKPETFITDTNFLKPRFYMVDSPPQIKMNRKIDKYRDADKREWDKIENGANT